MKRTFLFFIMTAFFALSLKAQDLTGTWKVRFDEDAGQFANKDVGIVEFKKDVDAGTWYMVGKQAMNNFPTKCDGCTGDYAPSKKPHLANQRVGQGFKAIPGKPGEFEGGAIVEPASGREGHGVKLKLVNPNTLHIHGFDKTKNKHRTVVLTKQ